MLLIDVMAGKTSDILDVLYHIKNKRPLTVGTKKVWVRPYVVPGYQRNKPVPKVVSIGTLRRRRKLARRATRILAHRA